MKPPPLFFTLSNPSLLLFAVRTVGSVSDLAGPVAYCHAFANSLAYHDSLLTYGAAADDSLRDASGAVMNARGSAVPAALAARVVSAMFGDACPFIGSSGVFNNDLVAPFSTANCEAFGGGLLVQGLHGALSLYLSDAHDICSRRGAAIVVDEVAGVGFIDDGSPGGVPYSIPEELNSAQMDAMIALVSIRVCRVGT